MTCIPLIIAGGAVQAGGFGLALYQSTSTRRREVPDTPSVLGWMRSAIARLLARPKHQGLKGRIAAEFGLRGALTPSEITLAQLSGRIDQLERDMLALIDERVEVVRQDLERREARRQSELRRSLRLEELGAIVFLLGLALTVAGTVI
jgi:hypothetical protein